MNLQTPFTINLFCDLFDVLHEHEKTIDDILYIKIDNKNFKPQRILDLFKGITYERGYSGPWINQSLQIVLKNGDFIIRGEYDGSEWFEYMVAPRLDEKLEDFDGYEDLIKIKFDF